MRYCLWPLAPSPLSRGCSLTPAVGARTVFSGGAAMVSAIPVLKALTRLLACAVGASLLYVKRNLRPARCSRRRMARVSGDNAASKYSPLDQIDATQRRGGCASPGGAPRSMPPCSRRRRSCEPRARSADAADDRRHAYASNGVGFVEAFDPGTGKTIWVEPPLETALAATAARRRAASATGSAATTRESSSSTANICSRSMQRPGKPDPDVRRQRPRLPVRGHGRQTCTTRGPARRS